jgi:O-antigen/teichoic acid export membrane protein
LPPALQRLVASDFARHVLTIGGGTGVAQVIMIGSSPIIARLYGPESIGLYALYTATVGIVSIAATAMYEQILMQPRTDRQAAALLAFQLGYGTLAAVVVAVAVLALNPTIAGTLGQPELASCLWALPLSVLLYSYYQGLRYWAMRRMAFADVARNTIVRGGGAVILACLFAFALPSLGRAPVSSLILSQLLAEFLGTLLLVRQIRLRDGHLFCGLRARHALAAARRYQRLALTLMASRGLSTVYLQLPTLAITWLYGVQTAGLYSWAGRFSALPGQFVADAIGDVYRQRAYAEYHRSGRFDRLTLNTLKVTILLGVVPYALGILLAPSLFAFAFGPEWREAGVYASILMVSSFFYFALTPIDKAIAIRQRTRFMFFWHIVRCLGKVTIIAAVYVTGGSVITLLALVVALRSALYLAGAIYSLHLTKG